MSATGGTIGGTNPGARNVISGNGTSGIEVSNDISGLLIQSNLIGTDVTGKVALGNNAGIFINTGAVASSVIVGGAGAAGRNIISGNKLFGISINSGDGNTISGNYIGTDITGNAALGNLATGLSIGSSSNTIGGLGAGDGNVISGNTGAGLVFGNNVTLNFVLGNLIGYGADGTTPVGNAGHGVWVYTGSNNIIGGLGKAGNSIAFNTGAGVRIENAGIGNQVSANSITANGGLGIDLEVSGVNANDQGDGDTGPNNLLNYPSLTSAIINGGTTIVTGTLNSAANTKFHIEFFANNSADPTGFGEGQSFIGSTDVTTDGNGNASLSLNSSLLSLGQFVSATTTDQALNTSEFSQSTQITAPGSAGSVQFSSAAYNVNENGAQATITVTRAGGNTGAASVQYATTDGTAKSASDYTSAGGTLVWASGDVASKTFVVPISNDSLNEANESINLSLTNASGATLGVTAAATLTIIDDDPKPTISIAGVSSNEGNSGQTTFAFTVTLSAASGQAVSVNYGTADGTASSGSDYQPATGQALFLAGQTSRQIAVAVNGDTQIEPDETFTLNLSSPINATISNGQAVGKIINDDNVAAPSLQFSAGNYPVQEDLGVVTITVTRTGDTSGTASVDYKTNDAMASQKGDFEYAAGRLTFVPGDASKTFQVLINEDMYPEGTETFGLALSNATGATVGQQSAATVTINDDAPESLTNPIDDAQSFVYQHYHDFLNREPDSAGLAFWANEISSCGQDQSCIDAKRANVSAAFYLSTEFQNTGYLVYRTYRAAYGNLPGAPVPLRFTEFVPDTNAVSRGVVVNQPGWDQVLESNKQTFMTEFVQRSRFTLAYPTSMTPMQFVDAISANAGITPSSGDRMAAINEFSGNPSSIDVAARARALRDVAENPLLTQQEFSRAFVLMQYFGYLRRDPDAAPDSDWSGYTFWLNKLNQFNGDYDAAQMVKAFINSGEYRQRFGQ